LSNRKIAETLFVSSRTAEGHVERLRNKLDVSSRAEIVRWVLAAGEGQPATSAR
jgi:DNA-binding CsgD family transcriptional regulator